MPEEALVIRAANKKRWNQLLDDMLAATGVRSMFKKSHITAIVIENGDKIPVRFVPEKK